MAAVILTDDPTAIYRLGFYVALAIVVTVVSAVKAIHRRQAMKSYAMENQFERLGDELVDGLYLRKTSFAWRELKISNSVKGSLNGRDIAVVDVTFDQENVNGRRVSRISQTVVAFRREGLLQGDDLRSTGQDNFHVEIAGDWLICFTDGVHIPADHLNSRVNDLYNRAARLFQLHTYPPLDTWAVTPMRDPLGPGPKKFN